MFDIISVNVSQIVVNGFLLFCAKIYLVEGLKSEAKRMELFLAWESYEKLQSSIILRDLYKNFVSRREEKKIEKYCWQRRYHPYNNIERLAMIQPDESSNMYILKDFSGWHEWSQSVACGGGGVGVDWNEEDFIAFLSFSGLKYRLLHKINSKWISVQIFLAIFENFEIVWLEYALNFSQLCGLIPESEWTKIDDWSSQKEDPANLLLPEQLPSTSLFTFHSLKRGIRNCLQKGHVILFLDSFMPRSNWIVFPIFCSSGDF